MDTCLYNNEEIYGWKLKDEDNQYDKELLGQWRRASERKQLHCVDCGENVFLKAGDYNEPHFSHYSGSDCAHNNFESQESLRGKRLLIKIAERSFPESNIETKYKMPDGKYSTVFIKTETGISIDFHYQELQNINYDERSKYYIDSNIPFLHVFSGNYDGKIRNTGIAQKYTIQKLQGYCIFLNMYKDSNTISIEYELTDKHPGSKVYEKFLMEDRITNYQINEDGQLFYLPTQSTIHELIVKFLESKQVEYEAIRLEQQRVKKELEVAAIKAAEAAKLALELAEAERYKREEERKRQQEELQRAEQLAREKRVEEQEKKKEEFLREEAIREHEREKRRNEFYSEMLDKHIIRRPYIGTNSSTNIYSMKVINESWILPPLLTRTGGLNHMTPDIRESYLKELCTWIFRANPIQKEQLISYAIDRIEQLRFVDEWIISESRKDFSLMKECRNCKDYEKFLCMSSYDDGWCRFVKCVSPIGVCSRVKKTCEYCHHKQI